MTTFRALRSSKSRLFTPFNIAVAIFTALAIPAGAIIGGWFVMNSEQAQDLPLENAALNAFVDNTTASTSDPAAIIPITAEQIVIGEYAIYWLDDGNADAPKLHSTWLAKLYTGPDRVTLIGLEATPTTQTILLDNPADIEATVAAHLNDSLSGYIVIDDNNMAQIVKSFAPLQIGQLQIDHTNLASYMSRANTDRERIMLQAAILQAIAADWVGGEIPSEIKLDDLTIYHTLGITEIIDLSNTIQIGNMRSIDISIAPSN